MRKKCLAIAKKAMVWTLAASMLVATPLTASAAGLRGVYSTSDGWNDDINDEDPYDSHTGTVTNTETSSDSGVLENNEAKIMGIALDKTHVNVEVGGQKETITATVVIDGKLTNDAGEDATEEMLSLLVRKIKWEVLNPDGSINADTNKILSIFATTKGDRSQITLNPRQGTKVGEDMIVRAKLDGRYYYDKNGQKWELIDNRTEGFSEEATVSIKEYSKGLDFIDMPENVYAKHTLDLNDHIRRDPETANDTITWISENTSAATVTAAGVVTFKTAGKEGKIIAVGEKGAKAEWEFEVEAGQQASKIEIVDVETEDAYKNNAKITADLQDDGWNQSLTVRMSAKVNRIKEDAEGNPVAPGTKGYATESKELVEDSYYWVVGENGEPEQKQVEITDDVTWTSNKPAIVSVDAEGANGRYATITAKAVGTAAITAKASSGKSAKLNVTVKATLNGLEITTETDHLYSGQTLQMEFERDPEANRDAVVWYIDKVTTWTIDKDGNEVPKQKTNPNASINNKGLLTIKPKLNMDDEEYMTVNVGLRTKNKFVVDQDEDGKDIKDYIYAETKEITIDQSSIDVITVTDDDGTLIANVHIDDRNKVKTNDLVAKGNNVTKISVPKNRTYTISATNSENDYAGGEETLKCVSSNAKIAEVTYDGAGEAKITAKSNGTATITVSGIRAVDGVRNQGKENEETYLKSASVFKTTFKVEVKQPVNTVTLNKPSVVLNEKTKKVKKETVVQDQKVSLKATLGPKGVGKKEAVHWSVKQTAGVDHSEALKNLTALGLEKKGKEVTATSVSVNLPAPQIGDVFEITARAESGASATSIVKVLEKTTAVAIYDADTKAPYSEVDPKKSKPLANTKWLGIGKSTTMQAMIATDAKKTNYAPAGTDNLEDVTYTVNKKGIVTIDSNGTVYAIKKGKVTITAKTPTGKSGKLTVEVK